MIAGIYGHIECTHVAEVTMGNNLRAES